MTAFATRDTDADWRHLGATEPHWGVFSVPAYKRDQLTSESLERFYEAGRTDIANVAAELERAGFGPLRAARALDFGCGVGRLAEAMTAYADHVTGYDISPGMLETARLRATSALTYVGDLPDGPFDWINSYLVIQHIPPARALSLMADLVDRLAHGGVLSLQMTVWADEDPSAPARRSRNPLRALMPPPAEPPTGAVLMYDHDLNAVVRMLRERGFGRLMLSPTDHGPHHGVQILARRETQA